jgi:hypothetical protein
MMMVAAMMVVALAGQAADALTAGRVKETAYARVARAQAIARDAAIHAAVLASNALSEPGDVIKKRDAAWTSNPRDPLRQAIVQAPCSVKVRELVKEDPLVVEAFVMNDRGTLVCSMAETSDYWQGDEAKWQRTFVDGKDAYVEDPAFDVSTGKYAIQVSVPIADGAKRIGAVTLTLKLKGQEAAAAPKN